MSKRYKKYWWGCKSCGYYGHLESRLAPEGSPFQKQLDAVHIATSPNCKGKTKIQVIAVVKA